jgi:ribosomal protein S18 acetylase RimI-like enzyme
MECNKKSFSVRKPRLNEVESLLELYLACYNSQQHLALCLGKSFMRDVFKWFITSDRTFTLVADQDGNFIGFLTVCNGQYHKLMFTNNKMSAIKALLVRPWVIFSPRILKRLARNFFRSDALDVILTGKDIAHCSFIGVHPSWRSEGVASTMSREMIKECHKRKWNKIIAGVYKKNMVSRRLQLKLGFKEYPLSSNKVLSVKYLDN